MRSEQAKRPRYDVIISALDNYGELPKDNYRVWLYNSDYVMLCENSLAEEIHLPQVEIDDLTYDLGELEFFDLSGFGGVENGTRWSTTSPATISLPTLESGEDYVCTLYLGATIPFVEAGEGPIEGSVVINGRAEDGFDFTLEKGQTELSFKLDGDLLDDHGDNVMSIYSSLWSPADLGLPDTRTLGISIDKIVFEKTE